MLFTFIVIVLTAAFFVWGRIRSDIVALCAMLLLMLSHTLTTEEALSGFSNNIVIMMAALFIVGGGIFQTGLAKMISTKILKLAGKSELKLFMLLMLVTAAIGSFVSNTGTVALMLPIVISLASAANTNPRRLLMPLAFASSMGGLMTLIGTPPNMIINSALINAGYEGLSFFSFLPVGLITLGIGLLFLWPATRLLVKETGNKDETKKKGKSLSELAHEYQLVENLHRIKISDDRHFAGKMLKDLDITQKYNITVIGVQSAAAAASRFQRRIIDQQIPGPETILRKDDVVFVFGDREDVEAFVQDTSIVLVDFTQTENEGFAKKEDMVFSQMGIAEVVLMSNSKMVDKKVRESDFRSRYNVTILGIQRNNEYILHDVKDAKMHAGDVLLAQGKWTDIAKMHDKEDSWVVIGEPMEQASKVPLSNKAPIAAAIMVLMVLAMTLNIVAPVTATLIAAVMMILTGCLRSVEAAYKTINWESIVMFAAMIPLSIAMEKTGASAMIAETIVSTLSPFGTLAVLAGIYLATMTLTMFISNTATAILFAPIAVGAAQTLGVNPTPFLFAVTVAASMCLASPFSTPPNALVMSAGRYTFMDYVKVGLPLQIIYAIVMILVLPLLFPF